MSVRLEGEDGTDVWSDALITEGALHVTGVADGNRISTTSFNSRNAATMAAGVTFQGVSEEVSTYGRAGVSVRSDNATDGTLTMEVSIDSVNWRGTDKLWADTSAATPHIWDIVEKYFRIKYVNGSTEATNLALQVHYSGNGSGAKVIGIGNVEHDYISVAYPDSVTEVYTYKTGGAGGTTVSTVTVVYTTSTKDVLTSVART